jgi:ferredoxin
VLRIKIANCPKVKRKEIKMKVYVDKELCSGSGVCIGACPEVFELNDQGAAVAKTEQVPSELEQTCRETAEDCPSGAIKVEE